MTYKDDEEESSSSSADYFKSDHGKKEQQERNAAQKGNLLQLKRDMLRSGVQKSKVTAEKSARDASKREEQQKLQQLRQDTDKVLPWATKGHVGQEKMMQEDERPGSMPSADATQAKEDAQKFIDAQTVVENPNQTAD